MMEEWKLSRLRADPRNHDLFEDVKGEEFEMLVESVKEVGLINPLTITPTGLIICGHQRYRALKAAGIPTALVTVRAVDDGDEDQKALIRIEEQARRRQLSPAQAMRVVRVWYRIHDIRQGKNAASDARTKLQEEHGIALRDQQVLNKIGTSLIPPLLAIFEQERIGKSVAYQIAQLDEADQVALLDAVGIAGVETATWHQARDWRAMVAQRDESISELTQHILELEERIAMRAGNADDAEAAARKDAAIEELSHARSVAEEKIATLSESLSSMIERTQTLESKVAEADRLTRFSDNNHIHRWLKGAQVLTGVTPAEYAAALKGDPALADFVEWHRERAMDAFSWLERYIRCLDDPVERSPGIRSLR